MGMDSKREPEAGRQPGGYVAPVVAGVVAAIDAAVVLLIEDLRIAGVYRQMMDALSHCRRFVRKEVGDDPLVLW